MSLHCGRSARSVAVLDTGITFVVIDTRIDTGITFVVINVCVRMFVILVLFGRRIMFVTLDLARCDLTGDPLP